MAARQHQLTRCGFSITGAGQLGRYRRYRWHPRHYHGCSTPKDQDNSERVPMPQSSGSSMRSHIPQWGREWRGARLQGLCPTGWPCQLSDQLSDADTHSRGGAQAYGGTRIYNSKNTAHHPMAAVNKVPGSCQGVPLSCASPMQIGMPITSPWKTLIHGTTQRKCFFVELQCCVPCSRRQASLASHCSWQPTTLRWWILCIICESIEALQKERMPAQPLLGYTTPQPTDLLSSVDSPMLQEVFRAASNLDTMIAGPPQVQPIQQPTQDCLPDPKIENSISNMWRHEKASQMPITDTNQ